ncbi:Cytochrome P450 3A41 [Trichoplax sp. H2]|nr:Cytochrome P450 3A41 [Trichoplax sp. H2]|eukprot:RDD38957.1 Cytochrome P450 3A41 [Trichoplax sp. H2]
MDEQINYIDSGFLFGDQLFYPVAILLISSILAYFLYRNIIAPLYYFQRLGIPSPKQTPFFGHVLNINRDGFQHTYLNYTKQMGPVYGLMFGRVPEMVISDLDMVKEITVKRFNQFINRAELINLPKESPFYDGLLRLRDHQWKRVRGLLVPTFSGAKMRQIITIMNNISQGLVDRLLQKCQQDGQIDIWQAYGQVTMQIILAIAFGVESHGHNGSDNLTKSARRITGVATRLIVLVPLFPSFIVRLLLTLRGKGRDDATFLRDTAMKVIESRRAHGLSSRKDLLQLMIDAGDNGKLTDTEVIAQSIVFLIAGYETTSNALAFTSYLLALNPDIQDKLIKEIDEKCPDENAIDYDTISNLTYLDMVLDEAMRIYPPAFRFNREASEDITINNIFIPKGMTVTIPIIAIHHDPKLWPNPDKFDPERFSAKAKAERNPYSYMPFGVGPRACIGMRLAVIEAKLILIRTLQQVRFTVVKETPIPLKFRGGVVTSPKNGIRLGLTPRNV